MIKNKLTEAEIMKALECCRDNDSNCVNCPYFKTIPCTKPLMRDALSLINRKNAEVERLRNAVEKHHIMRKDSKSPLSLLTEEIRAEAIKEYIATLKEKKGLEHLCGYRIFDWELYQIAQEMGVEL